jgi:hypothetical protein
MLDPKDYSDINKNLLGNVVAFILIVPIIYRILKHGFTYGWIYVVFAFFLTPMLWYEIAGAFFGIILWALTVLGSLFLMHRRWNCVKKKLKSNDDNLPDNLRSGSYIDDKRRR